jgi:glycosyltransferase involved in cell wall biosynthesis
MTISTDAITVLMPCRDAEDTVGLAAESILRQEGVADLYLLAVDDGSRDKTLAVLYSLAERDSRVTVVAQARLGLVAALNRGLKLTRTPLVARQDADDVSHPKRLKHQLELLTGPPEPDVVGCRIRGFPRGRIHGGMQRYENWQNRLCTHEEMEAELYIESPLAHATALMKTEAVRAAGAWRHLDGPEDWDLWARMFARGCRFKKVPRALYFWREHENRATRTDPRLSDENFRALKCAHLVAGPLRDLRKVELWSHGRQGHAWASLLAGSGGFEFSYRPQNPRPVVSGRAPLPPRPPGSSSMILVAYGAENIRNWFRDKLVDLGGQPGEDFLLIG